MQLLASEGREGAPIGGVVQGLDRSWSSGASQSSFWFGPPACGMEWLHWHSSLCPLGNGLPEGGDMYFVHSYAFQPIDPSHGLATSDYGGSFTAVVGKGSATGAISP